MCLCRLRALAPRVSSLVHSRPSYAFLTSTKGQMAVSKRIETKGLSRT
jgi:hypothetical protein